MEAILTNPYVQDAARMFAVAFEAGCLILVVWFIWTEIKALTKEIWK